MNNKYEARQGRYSYTLDIVRKADKRNAARTHAYLNARSMFNWLVVTMNVNQ